jgi:hypothetical protein
MEANIISNLNNPKQLEKLYRSNKADFKRAFAAVYAEIEGSTVADCWQERLNYQSEALTRGSKTELILVIFAAAFAGLIAKLPAILSINEDFFYPRNIGFIVFPILTAYFAWRNKLSVGKIVLIAGVTFAGLLFINYLPDVKKSDTLILSCVHLVLLLSSILGFAYVGDGENSTQQRLGFLKYNGDLIVMTTLILIAGGILTGITIGLFSLIGWNIEDYYFQNIGIFGIAAAPIVGTYLTQTNPHLVGKVSPVIAKLFSPLVAVMLVVYLVAIIYAGKNPYQNREFLLIFNALLVGVMAIIFFTVAEVQHTESKIQNWILTVLATLTIIVNAVALSAILFRISEWGFTPNRLAVLGGNVLILINLLLVTAQLFKTIFKRSDLNGVKTAIAFYLPVYAVWTIVVTFIFPFVFGFK